MWNYFFDALLFCMQPMSLVALASGAAMGLVVGALPGLSSPMAIVVLIPLTYGFNPLLAMFILLGIYVGTKCGGSFAAIMIRTPGCPAAACTAVDGHPMAEKGQAGLALGYAVLASTVGGFVGWFALFLFAPQLAKVAVKFNNADIAVVALVGLIFVATLSRGSMLKGLISTTLGLLISTVGLDPISGFARLTFGVTDLLEGISFIPAMIGLFAITVIFSDMPRMLESYTSMKAKVRMNLPRLRDFFSRWRALAAGIGWGLGIGAVPGVGSIGATWISYGFIKSRSKHPEQFGKGIPEGIMAPESANNSVTGGALIPMLTLGIPGDPSTAIMLGALMLHGLRPGPLFFGESPEMAYGVISGLLFANIFMFLIAWTAIPIFIRMLSQKRSIIFPFIIVLALIGSYANSNSMFAVWVALAFGFFGFFLEKFSFNVPCVVLAIILGPIIEENMRLALVISRGNWATFLHSWPSAVGLIIAAGLIAIETLRSVRPRRTG
jgi:putative tricarboxylic transport membrane protein